MGGGDHSGLGPRDLLPHLAEDGKNFKVPTDWSNYSSMRFPKATTLTVFDESRYVLRKSLFTFLLGHYSYIYPGVNTLVATKYRYWKPDYVFGKYGPDVDPVRHMPVYGKNFIMMKDLVNPSWWSLEKYRRIRKDRWMIHYILKKNWLSMVSRPHGRILNRLMSPGTPKKNWWWTWAGIMNPIMFIVNYSLLRSYVGDELRTPYQPRGFRPACLNTGERG